MTSVRPVPAPPGSPPSAPSPWTRGTAWTTQWGTCQDAWSQEKKVQKFLVHFFHVFQKINYRNISVQYSHFSFYLLKFFHDALTNWAKGPVTRKALLNWDVTLTFHWTWPKILLPNIFNKLKPVPLAQRIARWTSNPKVLGSIPRWDEYHFCKYPHQWPCSTCYCWTILFCW